MKFSASRLSEGNKVFPAQINIEPTGVTVKIPGLFSGESKFFDFHHIASVDVNAPMVGYSTITFYAGGTKISAHGFTSGEVKEIKQAIEVGKTNSRQSSSENYGGNGSGGTTIIQQKEGFATSVVKSIYAPMIQEGMKQNTKIYASIGKGIMSLFTMGARKKALALHNELTKQTDDIDILLAQGKKDEALSLIKKMEHSSSHNVPNSDTNYRDFWANKRKEYISKATS